MSFPPRTACLATLLTVLFAGALCAQEAETKKDEGGAPPLLKPATDFDSLVKQLDAEQFTDRQDASQKLIEAGADAVEVLRKAAAGDSREARTRAVEILKQHFEGDSEALKQAARAALQKLADGDQPLAARLAKQILEPKPAQPNGAPGVFQIGPAQIQIQVQGVANGRRNVRTKITNGVKEIEAEEDGRKVKIVDDPNNGIKMEITEKKDGKETTRKIEAKDADELKKKDAEAHKIFEEYSKGAARIQVQGIQLQPGRAIPLQLRPGAIRPFRRLNDVRGAAEQIEKASKQLDEAVEQLKKAIEDGAQADELKKSVERLEQVKKEVDEVKEKLGG
ncbi:MAG: hypothetical protein RIC55_24165 [Pirellulaceae bacterium]